MTLATPAWLLLSALALLILALHSRRRRPIEVSSVLLWRGLDGSPSATARNRRPPLSVPLLLQLLLLALLVLALTGPSFNSASDSRPHYLYVLDASASMQADDVAPTRFDAALERLEQEIGRLDSQARVSLLQADGSGRLIAARRDGGSSLRMARDRYTATHEELDWQASLARIVGVMREGDRLSVTLLTDPAGAESGRIALRQAFPDAEHRVVIIGGEPANRGFVAVEATALSAEDGEWRFSSTVHGTDEGPEGTAIRVYFHPAGTKRSLAWDEFAVELGDDRSATFEVEYRLPGAGLLELRLGPDALDHDNHVLFQLGERPTVARVLLVGEEHLFLQRALEAVGHVEVTVAESLPEDEQEYDLVVLNQYQPERTPATNTLWIASYPGSGGARVITGGGEAARWIGSHPVMRSVAWDDLRVSQAEPAAIEGATTLVEAAGLPLVQWRRLADRFDVAVSFRLSDSNWTASASFPIFLDNLVDAAQPARGRALVYDCTVGEPCRLALPSRSADWRIIGPNGDLVAESADLERLRELAEGATGSSFEPRLAGVYTLVSKGRESVIPVNAFSLAEGDLVSGEGGVDSSGQPPARLALWQWLVIAAAVLLIVEALIAGLGVDGFLRPGALADAAPWARRKRAALALQLVSGVLLLLAVTDTPLPALVERREVVLIVDDPRALPAEEAARLQRFVERVDQSLAGSRRAGLVRLAGGSSLAQEVGSRIGLPAGPQEGPVTADLERALSLAAASVQDGSRIVIAASGAETRGQVGRSALLAGQRDLSIDVLPLQGMPEPEVLVEEVSLPARIMTGHSFTVAARVYATASQRAEAVLLRDDEEVGRRVIELEAGQNLLEFERREAEAGAVHYRVAVTADRDTFDQNDSASAVAMVQAPARVLIVTRDAPWAGLLVGAFEHQGIDAVVQEPVYAPRRIEGWLEYDAVVLMNTPALELHSAQQAQLAEYVEIHGGGLLILGGENSFGPGGYYRTPLEELSPLSSRVPQEAPEVAMLFILDRSGSMQQLIEGVSRLEIALEATVEAIGLLNEASLTGVVAFDSEARLLVPMQPAANRAEIAATLETLRPAGGTSIYPALVEALPLMESVESPTRHVVVLTDGLSQPGDFEGILARYREAGITVSSVAIGQGANLAQARSIAEFGDGVFHASTDFRSLPSILSQEALLLSESLVEEGTFTPRWENSDLPFAEGLPDPMPDLHGYVATSPKPEATIALVGPDDDPLLASWRYGLGRVIALTTHGAGEWSREWVALDSFPRLVSQMASWVYPSTARPGLNPLVERVGDLAVIEVEAVTPGGEPADGLDLRADVERDGSEVGVSIALRETEPGLYRAESLATAPGQYRFSIGPAEETAEFASVEALLAVPYEARYRFSSDEPALLGRLAAATGGRILEDDDDLFAGIGGSRFSPRSAWRAWLALAVATFLAGLACRYLSPRAASTRTARFAPDDRERAAGW